MDLGCFHKYIAFYAYINCCKTNSSLRVEIFEHFLNTETVMKSSKPLSISICDYLKRFDSGLRHDLKGFKFSDSEGLEFFLYNICTNYDNLLTIS